MHFNKYQHIERIGSEEVDGLLEGKCYVYYKIDGTNGSIYLGDDGQIRAGSRNRELTIDNDNAGFYTHVLSNPKYSDFLNKYPNTILYGEWLVPHTLKTYRSDAWRDFYVFDVIEDEKYLTYEEYKDTLEEFGINYIPPICTITNPSEEKLIQLLEKTGDFLVEDGKGLGEGIVVKNYNFVNRFGRTTWGKIVRTEFKEKHGKNNNVNELLMTEEIERKIIDEFVTDALVSKEKAKITCEKGCFEGRDIPRLLGTVYYCLVSEETWNFIRKHKFPKVDFNKLRKYCESKTKELAKV